MSEVFSEALAYYNLPLTVMLVLILLYWLMVIVGVLGMESFDIEAGADLDADVDVDADFHGDVDGHPDLDVNLEMHGHGGAGGLGLTVLRFLNFGQVPAMVVISILVLTMWFFSMVGNFVLNGSGSLLIAGAVFLASLFGGALLAKLFTAPLKPVFRALNRNYDTHEPIVGRTCVVKSLEVSDKSGQAEIERAGATLLINVRVAEGTDFLRRGNRALVVEHDAENEFFIIREDRTESN